MLASMSRAVSPMWSIPEIEKPSLMDLFLVAWLRDCSPARSARAGGQPSSGGGGDVVAAVRQPDVGERVEQHATRMAEGAVLHGRDGRVGCVAGMHERVGRPGDGPELDGYHVIGEPSTVGEAGEIAAEDAQAVRCRALGDGQVEAQLVGRDRA